MVMKPAENSARRDAPVPLSGTKAGRILGEGPARPDLVVVAGVMLQYLPQVSFAQDNEAIKALTPD